MSLTNLQDSNLESIYVIWLDRMGHESEENICFEQHIRSITNHLKLFQTVQDCEKYINQTSKDDRILLIVSGQLGREILPKIHHCRQIFSIYVYCMNKKQNEEWSKKFCKIKQVIIKPDELLKCIQMDQLQRFKNKIDEPCAMKILKLKSGLETSTRDLNGEFLHSQLLIDCLLRMKSNSTDKNELINLCKTFYEKYPKELNLIKEFEQTYSPYQAIRWYTRESFIYRLLNKALRIQNIDLLYRFRFFIQDIEEQLKQCQCSTPLHVYRGQLMSDEELDQLKMSIGEYISISSFFSTSLNRQQALKFLNEYTFPHNLKKVLFEINADPQLENLKPFSNISSLSFYSNEHEVLFMLGSIFHLVNIKQEKKDLWVIQMILSNNNDENLRQLSASIKNEYSNVNNETSLHTFANILYQMGKYDLAEKYFHLVLKDLPSNHEDIPKCYHSLGVLALLKDDFNASLNWHEMALKLLKPNDSRLADSYHSIGCIYQKKESLGKALDYYDKAFHIWKNHFGKDYYKIADCLNNMGCVYENEKNYTKALECHQNALLIRKKNLPKNHSDIGASYNNIGNIYFYLKELDLALENYKYSYDVKLKSLPSKHSSLASTLENIGLVYEEKKLYEHAVAYYEKAADIIREVYSSSHSHVIEIQENIQRILSILSSKET